MQDSNDNLTDAGAAGSPASGAGLRLWLLILALLVPVRAQAGLLSWGANEYGQSSAPANLLDDPSVISIDAGREHSVALLADGSVRAWGYAGDQRSSPPVDLSDVIAIDAGSFHTLAVRRDRTVTGWGFNGAGMLNIPPGLSNVVAVAAGGFHSLALRGDGIVVGWGFDGNGRTLPPPSLTDVISIDAGRDHSLALKSDGTVTAWGLNNDGQSSVPAGLSGVIAIAAGDFHNLALKSDGSIVAWGRNVNGQSSPPAGLSGVVAIDAGSYHSLALRGDGTVAAWGDNSSGQLGIAGAADARAIAAGGLHSMALSGRAAILTAQPQSRSVLAGNSVVFSVAALGDNLSYQWQKDGLDLPGAVGAQLALAEVSRFDSGIYSVRVGSASGTIRSADAVLVVRGLHQLAPLEFLSDTRFRISFGDRHGVPLTGADVFRYQLQSSSDLVHWTTQMGELRLVDGRIQADFTVNPNLPREFFRVIEP